MSPRSRARVVASLVGLAIGTVVLWRLTSATESAVGAASGDDRAPSEVGSARRTGARRASVPKLFIPPTGDEAIGGVNDDGPEPTAGNDDLDVSQRAAIDQLEETVRAEAAAAVGLDAAERAAIAAIRADFDAHRGRFEAQLDPATHMLETHASAAILGNARAAQRALERVLGPERAAALRAAERAAFDRVIHAHNPDAGAAPTPSARRMLVRRLGGRPMPGEGPR